MICISITPKSLNNSILELKKAEKLGDLVELRLDYQEDLNKENLLKVVKAVIDSKTKPLIITLRSKKEGGLFPNNPELQVEILLETCKLDVEYIDIELEMTSKLYKSVQKRKLNSKIIASYHNFKKTLSPYGLRHIARKLNNTHADILKIACFANNPTDNLNMLELIDVIKRRFKKDIVALCMGEKGVISRVLQESMHGFMTFCCLDENSKSAPGQITVDQLKNIKTSLNI